MVSRIPAKRVLRLRAQGLSGRAACLSKLTSSRVQIPSSVLVLLV